MTLSPKLLFATPTYDYLAEEFCHAGGFARGTIERRSFPDGEIYRRVVDDPWGRDVVLLGGTPTDADWLDVYDLGYAIARAGARSSAGAGAGVDARIYTRTRATVDNVRL